MKALVKFGKTRAGMGLRDVPVPEPKEGEIRLEIKAAGICGSDIHTMNDERKTAIPVVLGHEFVGVIDKTCGDVGDLKVGDWVTGIPASYYCGECEYCKAGEVTLCPTHESVGVFRDGGMTKYMVMRAKTAYKIPDDAPDKLVYAAAEPLGTVVRGVYERITVNPGDVAVVSGPGTLGLFAVQVLKTKGAYVIASGLPVDEKRLELAKKLGADAAVQSYEELEAAVKAVSPRGADVSVECAGVAPSLNNCLKILKIHGQMLELGIISGVYNVDMGLIFAKELTVAGSNSTAFSTWDITMDLINSGKVDLVSMTDMRIPLDEWEKGFDATIAKTAYKVLLIP